MAQTAHTRKTRLACDSCRRQRRKCDRRDPACSLCVKRSEVCVYDPTVDQRSPEQRDYVAALEARVALLEGVLRDAGTRDIAGSSGIALANERDSPPAMRAVSTPPMAPTQPEPTIPGFEPEFAPSDDAAQALAPVSPPSPGAISTTTSDDFDLGMDGYVPLVNLDMEHKLLAQFWDWQRMHMPFVAPVPFLAAYALYAQVAHPGEPIPPPPPPPPLHQLAGLSAIGVPSPESVHVTPELAQFISPLLLDAMFVIGALFHGNAKLSSQFYKRAEARVIGEAAKPRLATVQGVMLMDLTELGHARAPAAWTLHGVAVALCVRLGMHVDATPLVHRGTMSKTLFEARNFVFWTTYNGDRLFAMCLGMHPLMDRRLISTPRHSSLAAANVAKPVHLEPDASVAGPSSAPANKPAASGAGTTWWSPTTLGLGDVIVQAGWEAIRDLARIMDALFDGIYSFDTPKRSPQEDLELVARNNLTIQRFLDDLPTWLRSTDSIRLKYNGIVYLHLFIHLASILTCRPFLSPRPLSEEAIRIDATTDISQPTHSSHIIRRYRTLAFRIARASALQITSLVRHIPLSSPCMTVPYFVYTACTILLLVPNDTTAMSGVRTGVTCLESLYETGYWSDSMKDGRGRVLALARRWGVDIGQGKRELGFVVKGRGEGSGTGGPSTAESDSSESDHTRPSDTSGDARAFLGRSNGTGSILWSGSGIGGCATRPSASTAMYGDEAKFGTTYSRGGFHWVRQYGDDPLAHIYVGQEYTNDVYAASLPQENDITLTLDTRCDTVAHDYGAWERTRNSCLHTGGLTYAESVDHPSYAHQRQFYAFAQPVPLENQYYGVNGIYFSPQYQRQPRQPLREQQQQTRHQSHTYDQSQESKAYPSTQHHVQIQQCYPQHYYEPTPSAPLPHVARALSHADPLHDSQLPYTRQRQVVPSTDPNFPSPSDPVACADLPGYPTDTIQMAQEEPAFLRTVEDPYAGVAVDWLLDAGCGFPAGTLDVYTGLDETGSSTGMGSMGTCTAAGMNQSGGAPVIYARGDEAGRRYAQGHPAYGYDGTGYVGEYGSQEM